MERGIGKEEKVATFLRHFDVANAHLRRARRAAAQPREEENRGGKRTGGPRRRGEASS